MALSPTQIDTAHLALVPASAEIARAILAGDLSAVDTADGWPHDGTLNGLRMALQRGHAPGWFVTLDGIVIGDCGVHSDPNEHGEVEIGFGLAAPYRGKGYGTETVIALSRWLLEQPGVTRVSARALFDNQPSRRVLERAGFVLHSADARYAGYVLDAVLSAPPAGPDR